MDITMPAFCSKCENIFSSGISVKDPSSNITFKGALANCPQCGEIGIIPDGAYDFIENTIRVLSGPEATLESLRRLKAILDKAKDDDLEPQQVAEIIKREIPEQSLIADDLAKAKKDDFRFKVMFVLGLLAIVIPAVMGTPGFLNESDALIKRLCSTKEGIVTEVIKMCENQTKETQKKLSSSEKKSKGFQKQSKDSQKKSKGFQKQPKNKN
ncbi:hypothetical protein [Leptolyngbya sp. FACHB-17]|uniref:hypothetical protein n=1 Tax=unclassified Leptolyngbya TaxID=2650499 RepID=UPI0016802D77|nr:hypothetical protein [Leptolyngbya sp. FACHB-17]MBD2080175.1 hypothetical protein [Leptolyngbya sp. FACHB-17]